jgi:hypothetical protein
VPESHRPIGCTTYDLDLAEIQLGHAFPVCLRGFYADTNGIFNTGGQWWVVWQLERLVHDNLAAWSSVDSRLPSTLLAFGDDGTGNPFCLDVSDSDGEHVLRWSWIDGAVETDEGSFGEFLDE